MMKREARVPSRWTFKFHGTVTISAIDFYTAETMMRERLTIKSGGIVVDDLWEVGTRKHTEPLAGRGEQG